MADLEAGFAKLQGEDFEYYMQTYSIVLGRNSTKSAVDVDLAGLGGGMHISRHHARIFYDFERRRFVLEVLGKNGCYVEGVLHFPGKGPIKLDSQDLLQIGDKKFYFLLPARKIARAVVSVSTPAPGPSRKRPASSGKGSGKSGAGEGASQPSKKSRGQGKTDAGGGAKEKKASSTWNMQDGEAIMAAGSSTVQGRAHHSDHQRGGEAESEMLQEEIQEREMITAVAAVLQDLCAAGEWLPMSKLHSELLAHYHGHTLPKVRRGADDGGQADGDGKGSSRPWSGLVALLRRHPQHFLINTKLKGRITAEYVSLVVSH